MSINAIGSISLYEYYYTIDNNKKKNSPLADELKKYGIQPTADESLNATLLERAKRAEIIKNQAISENKESSTADRPWADIMYQLGLRFNDDPIDDIQDIKDELKNLLSEIKDEELEKEVNDLENHVETLYIAYSKNNVSKGKTLLDVQMNNISTINKANLL